MIENSRQVHPDFFDPYDTVKGCGSPSTADAGAVGACDSCHGRWLRIGCRQHQRNQVGGLINYQRTVWEEEVENY